MQSNLNTFEINNNKVVTELDVSFKRKNQIYKKVIFIIMTTNMETNIQKKNNIQYFLDVTYYVTPPTNKKYKLFVLLAFNKDLFKTIICNLSIIENENKETFVTILEYLKVKYNWLPERISIDYSRAERNALMYLFPNIEIIPCFFHFMENIIKHFNEIRSNNKTIKNLAKDCLSNIKLLCFIPLNNFKTFYKLILDKYRCKFPSFFKYFDKNYIKGRVLDKKHWNYNNIITNNLNNDILFYTNNIVESFNNNLNKKFIGFAKTMHNFKNALNDVINLYEMSDAYKEKRLSITRALAHYVNNQNEFDLINSKDIVKIKENYKRHLISNKLPIDENDDNKSEESD